MIDQILIGECRESMRTMIAAGARAQTCVTSPPYFGLRDYGVVGQIGLEDSPAEYVTRMVEVFAIVWELLADDGTLWLNLGDSYTGSGKGGNPEAGKQATNRGAQSVGRLYGTGGTAREVAVTNVTRRNFDLGAKQLIGIPWRVAFALQDFGWVLRQDIIWHKPNPMPESVKDRCTKAHEYLFLFSKRAAYYFDTGAIQEPSRYAPGASAEVERPKGYYGGKWKEPGVGGRHDSSFKAIRDFRNKRDVWTVAARPYSGAHFATFPPDLIRPCVRAGAPVGGVVLDPFMGSGTTAQVAIEEGRHFLGCELNPEYQILQAMRIADGLTARSS